jgi:hypothetical protein
MELKTRESEITAVFPEEKAVGQANVGDYQSESVIETRSRKSMEMKNAVCKKIFVISICAVSQRTVVMPKHTGTTSPSLAHRANDCRADEAAKHREWSGAEATATMEGRL